MAQKTTNRNFTINIPSVELNAGEKLIFKFGVTNISPNNNFTASINEGNLKVSSLAASTGYSVLTQTSGTGFFHSASMADTGSNTTDIVLSSALSGFWDNNYIFVPNPLTGSFNSLYSGSVAYGDVDYNFSPNPPCHDIVLVYLDDNTYIEARVLREFLSGSFLHLTLDTTLSSTLRAALANQTYTRFLFLSRRADETNVITTFSKRDGATSYGFLIPQDLSKNVLDNIDVITKEVKQKLLNDQQSITLNIS
jgi:hypothetical protein